jgi:putative ABC transport system substrate-binding protein
MEGKRISLLHELVPRTPSTAILINPGTLGAEDQIRDAQEAAGTISKPLHILRASTRTELDSSFLKLRELIAGALVVAADPFFNTQRQYLIDLAARQAIPVVYEFREFPVAGRLMSYGPSLPEAYRQVGLYTGRVLGGAKPADLPVIQPSKFELVINLRTANALALDVPASLLARADEVIE